jgi:hypothetical protein
MHGSVGQRRGDYCKVATKFRPTSEAISDILTMCPNLAMADWHITSPYDDGYQCAAWATCRINGHWWPCEGYQWFPDLPLFDSDVEAPLEYFLLGFSQIGYEPCESSKFEFGYQKIAIYANEAGVTHLARQDFFGRGWLSKIGDWEDIFHRTLGDVVGSMSESARQYGMVVQVMKRAWRDSFRDGSVFRCAWFAVKFRMYRLWQIFLELFVWPIRGVFSGPFRVML